MSTPKKPKQRVTEYYMSVHYAICQGPVDTLSRIRINDKVAWLGAETRQSSFRIDNMNLFGGVKKEGGVQGQVYYQPGSFTQKIASYLASKLGLTPDTAPGYRGIATAFFTENGSSARSGFYWSANQPYIPSTDFLVTRLTKSWYPERAMIAGVPDYPLAVSFTIDNSGSMAEGDRLATMKTAMTLALDRIQGAIQSSGLQIDIHISRWGDSNYAEMSFANATAANINTLKSFVNGFSANSGGTDFRQAARGALDFFNGTLGKDLGARVWVFLTDGEPTGTTDDQAAFLAADLLNRATGNFNSDNGTAVDVFAVNIEELNTSRTAKLDNTDQDGVPVILENDPAGLLNVIQSAIFGGVPPDLNPAHIIHETLTNRAWGMGAPFSGIDDVAFRAAADQLFFEGFGMSMIWAQQTEVENFVQEVLDHIEANLYVDPRSGKFVLKLIRDDYDEETLPILDESNSTVVSYSRRSPAEIINEINLTWTNPESEKEEVLTIQDLGGIVQSGGEIISDSRNYYGVRRKDLAWQLAQRDISAATARLSTAEIEVDRRAWAFTPGAVLKLNSDEHGAVEEIMRVVKIDYGKPGDSMIRLNVTQDIFSFERPVYELPPDTEFEDSAQPPTTVTDVIGMTLNYFLSGYYVQVDDLTDTEYPSAWVGLLASTNNPDAQEYELIGPETDPAGNTFFAGQGTRNFVARGELLLAFEPEAETVSEGFGALTNGLGPRVGGFGLIGGVGVPEEESELVLFSAYDGTNWTIRRGVLDTIPRAWPVGTPIRFFNQETFITDQEERAAAEEVDYKLLMRTSIGLFNELAAPTFTYTLNERPHLPTRPANVTINGIAFEEIDGRGVTEFTVAWANRNRITEGSQVLVWDDPSVTPEDGQTTKITILNADDRSFVNEITGLTGTSYLLPLASFLGTSRAIVRVTSERDGFESFMGYEQRITLAAGYGLAYGTKYGG